MDWFRKVKINDEITVTMLPAQHWSKRWIWGEGNTDRSLWGSFLIEYKGKKIFFACDTGPAPFYKELGKRFGSIDLAFGNIGAYNFYPIIPVKDKSVFHTNPEELLSLMRDLKVKKVVGMHWGTAILSLEPIWEPPIRFKSNAEKFGYQLSYGDEQQLLSNNGKLMYEGNTFTFFDIKQVGTSAPILERLFSIKLSLLLIYANEQIYFLFTQIK